MQARKPWNRADNVAAVGHTLYSTLLWHDLKEVIPSLKQMGINGGQTFFLLSPQDVDTMVERHGCVEMKGRLLKAKLASGELKSYYTWKEMPVSNIFDRAHIQHFGPGEWFFVLVFWWLWVPWFISGTEEMAAVREEMAAVRLRE